MLIKKAKDVCTELKHTHKTCELRTIDYPFDLKLHIRSALMILSQDVTLTLHVAFYDIVSRNVQQSHSSNLDLVHN